MIDVAVQSNKNGTIMDNREDVYDYYVLNRLVNLLKIWKWKIIL